MPSSPGSTAVRPPHPGLVTSNPVLAAHPIVTTAMGWRILAFGVLIVFGLAITFLLDGKYIYGALWCVVTVGWGFFAYKLRAKHEEYVASL